MPATTFTTRLALRKPDPDPSTGDLVNVTTDISASMDKLDAAVGAIACTSGARPGSPYNGQFARETDTGCLIVWNGASWLYAWIQGGKGGIQTCTSGARPGSPFNGQIAYETDTKNIIVYDTATSLWRVDPTGSSGAPHSEGFNTAMTTTGAMASSSYANVPGIGSLNFTKIAGTKLKIDLSASCYTATALQVTVHWGVLVNGADNDVCHYWFQSNSTEHNITSGTIYIAGLAAGAWTIQPRWKRITASGGTVSLDINADNLCLNVTEVQ